MAALFKIREKDDRGERKRRGESRYLYDKRANIIMYSNILYTLIHIYVIFARNWKLDNFVWLSNDNSALSINIDEILNTKLLARA